MKCDVGYGVSAPVDEEAVMSERVRQLAAKWREKLGGGGDVLLREEDAAQIRRARVSILAAKWAYQTKDPRWLVLWARAVSEIEACPRDTQAALVLALSALQKGP